MIRDDRIDLITISVKVPAHRELVLAALNAGKAVYCEAPLGRTVAEAEEMASAVGSNPIAPTNSSMSCSCWNHSGINREPNHFGACLSHLIRHHVSVNVERGLDVRVPHKSLLHRDRSS